MPEKAAAEKAVADKAAAEAAASGVNICACVLVKQKTTRLLLTKLRPKQLPQVSVFVLLC